MRLRTLLPLTAALFVSAARADLTIHYKSEFKGGSGLPPGTTDAMKLQMQSFGLDSTIRIKGDKVLSTYGPMTMLIDYSTGQLTLIHAAGKRYSNIPASELGMHLNTPAARQALENVQFDIKTERSGKTAVIHGMPGEETVLTMSIDLPNPAGVPINMKMEIHNWIASADVMQRFPELKQWDAKRLATIGGMDPGEIMTSAFAQGANAAKLRAAINEIRNNSTGLSLKTETRVFMPAITQMLHAQGIAATGGPLVEVVMELESFSADPLADSLFQVPADYQFAPFDDVMKEVNPFKQPMGPVPVTTIHPAPEGQAVPLATVRPAPEGQAVTGPASSIYRVGGGVSAPRLTRKTDPSYTEEARAARIQGTVLLYVVVAEDGQPTDIRVLRSLDPGLDAKAIEAVRAWQFAPGMKDGKPVKVQAQIEVNFRLLDKPNQ